MVSVQLLDAGIAILVIGAISLLAGKAPARTVTVTDYRDERVNLAPEGQQLFIKRYSFGVLSRSKLRFKQKFESGPFDVFVIPFVAAPPVDALAGWGFPHGRIGDHQTETREFWIDEGNHAIEFVNKTQSPSSTVFTLSLDRRVPLVPWLDEIGSSLLVIAVPLLVTALLS